MMEVRLMVKRDDDGLQVVRVGRRILANFLLFSVGVFFFSSSFGRRWVTLLIFVERWFEAERERCLHFELYQTPSTLLPRLLFHAASQFYSSNDKIILIVHSKIIPLKCCLPANA